MKTSRFRENGSLSEMGRLERKKEMGKGVKKK
jgi:hypothetical protein